MVVEEADQLRRGQLSGDKGRRVHLDHGGDETRGPAFIETIVSPCVAFNNHAGSTKAYDFVHSHNEAVNRLDFITGREQIKVDLRAGHASRW